MNMDMLTILRLMVHQTIINIKNYAVNGAIHYADAILQYTSYTDVISIGITGYKDEHDNLQIKIGVYFVSKDNYGEGKKVAEFCDLSFLKRDFFDDFIEKVHSLELTPDDLKRIHDKRENQIDDALSRINQSLFQNKEANLSAQSRINLVAASIMANLGVPGKVSPLEPKDLTSTLEDGNTDGDIMLRKIENFLNKRKLPERKRKQIMNSLSITILDDTVNLPNNGSTLLKEVFTEIIDELGYYYKVGLDTDFTGKLFNTMFSWLSFAGDDQNDVVLTPRYVAHLMAKLCRVNMDSYVWDFATGSAGLLVAAMHQMIQDAKESISSPQELEDKIESIKKEQILGIEVVAEIYMLAVLNMILMGDGSSNIIKGDMSFVGPRPERAYYIKQIEKRDPRYYMLYQIRPGVTSYATLYNGYTDTIEKMLIRLNYDLDYLEHRSWALDLTIMLKTCLFILFGKNF